MNDQTKADKGFEALERCVDKYGEFYSTMEARAELALARQQMELLEKVAHKRHASNHSGNYPVFTFDTCPDELCAAVRRVLGGER